MPVPSRGLRSHRTAAILALVATVATLSRLCMLRGAAEANRRYGVLTPAQVIERTRRICRVVWPQESDADLVVDRDLRPAGRGPRVVQVMVRRPDGTMAGGVMWSEETGELLRVMADRDWRGIGAPRSRAELRILAAHCIRDLDVGGADRSWRLAEETGYPASWIACFLWRSADRKAVLHLDTESGNLVVLIVETAAGPGWR